MLLHKRRKGRSRYSSVTSYRNLTVSCLVLEESAEERQKTRLDKGAIRFVSIAAANTCKIPNEITRKENSSTAICT